MVPQPTNDDRGHFDFERSGKTEFEWAWEFHKNCDQLLHQRLAAFTASQAMTLTAFMVLTVARFQEKVTLERAFYVDFGRYVLAGFGIFMTIFGFAVTYPMLMRLRYLNTQYLERNPVYYRYIHSIEYRLMIVKFYRNIIPFWLPLLQLTLWFSLIVLTSIANHIAPTNNSPSIGLINAEPVK